MLLVAGIDAFRRIADEKIAPPLQAGAALEDRHADFFGRPGVDGRFEDDGRATFQVPADRFARGEQRPEVRAMRVVHRRGHRNDDEVGVVEVGRFGCDLEPRCRLELRAADFPGRIMALAIRCHLRLGQVETDGRIGLSELDGQGQAYIPQANYGDNCHFDSLVLLACSRPLASIPVVPVGRATRYSVFSSAATSAAQPGLQVSCGVFTVATAADFCAPLPLLSGAGLTPIWPLAWARTSNSLRAPALSPALISASAKCKRMSAWLGASCTAL